jgi:predicted AAA+ superfamily ATPase
MKRLYEPLLREYLRHFPCVALIGPRQCGKTTLLGTLPRGFTRFDLEDDADYQIVARDPAAFLALHPEKLAIDEAQILPHLFGALRVAIDRNRRKKGRFVLTGSASPGLVRSISESLAGRVGLIEMAPFTAAEGRGHPTAPLAERLAARRLDPGELSLALRPRLSASEVEAAWFRGGYPEPYLARNARFRALWMQNYVRTYLERDVQRLFPGLNQARFRTFLRLTAGLSGTIVNYSEVARTLGVSQPTARDYFDIAHGTFLWRTVPAFAKNTLKRIVKHPKGYLRDTGLLHHLLRIPDARALASHPIAGASWEGLVVENLLRGLASRAIEIEACYYRTGAGAEVDLVLEGDFGLVPIEIKLTRSVDSRKLRALADFVAERRVPLGIVINNDEAPRRYTERIVGVPFAAL